MKVNRFSFILMATIVAISIAGCSSGGSTPTEPPGVPPNPPVSDPLIEIVDQWPVGPMTGLRVGIDEVEFLVRVACPSDTENRCSPYCELVTKQGLSLGLGGWGSLVPGVRQLLQNPMLTITASRAGTSKVLKCWLEDSETADRIGEFEFEGPKYKYTFED